MIRTTSLVQEISDVPSSWIFETYCNLRERLTGQDIPILSLFNSRDTKPSMIIFQRDGKYFFKDFSTDLGGDGVVLVEKLFSLNRGQALAKIIGDYSQFVSENGIAVKKEELRDRIIYELEDHSTREWNVLDAKYWQQYGIGSEILQTYGVKPIDSVTFSKNDNGEYSFFTYNKPYMYGYYREDGSIYKIYQPLNPDKKFMKLAPYTQGTDQLTFTKPYLVIVSSLKDGMCLRNFGYNIEFIAPDSESTLIRKDTIDALKAKYTSIACLFDNDEAGIRAMKKYHDTYDLPYIVLPLEKDISDSVKIYGYDKVREILQPLLKKALKNE
jgi:hypothetical protein